MPHARPHKRKKAPKRVLALPDLEHAKPAVLSSLTSRSGQRTLFREYVDEVSVECLRIGDFSNLSNQAESLPQDQIDVLTNKPARVQRTQEDALADGSGGIHVFVATRCTPRRIREDVADPAGPRLILEVRHESPCTRSDSQISCTPPAIFDRLAGEPPHRELRWQAPFATPRVTRAQRRHRVRPASAARGKVARRQHDQAENDGCCDQGECVQAGQTDDDADGGALDGYGTQGDRSRTLEPRSSTARPCISCAQPADSCRSPPWLYSQIGRPWWRASR
jgi:hypothetical protein